MRHLRRHDDPEVFARQLWGELGQTAKVHAALDAWHAINSHDLKRCQYWQEVFAELDRLENLQTVYH